jgi:hypothetical protein
VNPEIAGSENGPVFLQMARNILDRLERTNLHRIEVEFFLDGTSFDQLIGRSAHMMYLENTCFMNTLKYRYWKDLFT